MTVQKLSSLAILLASLLICLPQKTEAEELLPFNAQVNKDNINIRTDSTINSEIICNISKGASLEVVREYYGWSKVRLPKSAPSFIRKDLIGQNADGPAKVVKERVNIRLRPNESSPILGKADKNEIINILGEKWGWYKIEPTNNCFGWISKGFLVKLPAKNQTEPTHVKVPPINKGQPQPDKKDITPVKEVTIEGIVKPQGIFFKRMATHKLITTDNKIYLLKRNKPELDTVNHRKVKISGALINLPNQKYPLIEIKKFEVID
jgi:uncharacterized protein YgiM (DUF1202 family)